MALGAVGEKSDLAVGEVVAVELEELVAAGVARKDERATAARIEAGPADRLGEERELATISARPIDEVDLIGLTEPRRDQHLAGAPDGRLLKAAPRISAYGRTAWTSAEGTGGSPSADRLGPGSMRIGTPRQGGRRQQQRNRRSESANLHHGCLLNQRGSGVYRRLIATIQPVRAEPKDKSPPSALLRPEPRTPSAMVGRQSTEFSSCRDRVPAST